MISTLHFKRSSKQKQNIAYAFLRDLAKFEIKPNTSYPNNMCDEVRSMVKWNIAAEPTFRLVRIESGQKLNKLIDIDWHKPKKTNYNEWPLCSSSDFKR